MVTLKERSKTDKTQAENLTFAALAKKKKKIDCAHQNNQNRSSF